MYFSPPPPFSPFYPFFRLFPPHPSQAARLIYGADADPLNQIRPAHLAGPLLERAMQKLQAEGSMWHATSDALRGAGAGAGGGDAVPGVAAGRDRRK